MSSAVLSSAVRAPFSPLTASLPLRPFPEPSRILELPHGVVPGARLEVRPAPATVPSGIAELDGLTGGLPRGALSEIFGPASSGRTSLILAALAAATRRQEVCALVDAGDSLHPESATAAGVDLQRLLWIRCGGFSPQRHKDTEKIDNFTIDDGRLDNQQPTSDKQRLKTNGQRPTSLLRIRADQLGSGAIHPSSIANRQSSRNSKPETRNSTGHWPLTTGHRVSVWDQRLTQVLKTTDLLLQSGGFGMVVVDLADVPPRWVRRIPLASWFRFRRAVENTPTVLLVVEQEPYAKTCASLALKMQPAAVGNQHSACIEQSALSSQHSAGEGLRFQLKHLNLTVNQTYCASNHLPAHAQILRALPVCVEVVHDRFQRKPVRSAVAQFAAHASWSSSVAG